MHWQLVDLRFRRKPLPEDRVVKGALINLPPTVKEVEHIMRLGCPVVRVGRLPHPLDDQVPAVVEDLAATGRMAAEYFAERGFHDVGYIGREPWADLEPMYHGFHVQTVALGGRCHLLQLRVVRGHAFRTHYDKCKRAVADWLADLPQSLGLFAFSDQWAVDLCNILTELGYAMPYQVAVLGRGDNPDIVNCCLPRLSSIAQDHDRRYVTAVDMLQHLMCGEKCKQTKVYVPPKGVSVRESTDIVAAGDIFVGKALQYIWQNYHLDISVDDVARETGVARFALERRFRKHLQRGVAAEIVRKRLDVFVYQLCTTKDPIAVIALRCGFRTMPNLYMTFAAKYGMSPREYRARRGAAEGRGRVILV